ncbi:hypothetical protein GYMLUDRAFT_241036 [Collybiopsis luxurians FD-317 M1]|nr:hypothetical protein GYMLUDRAFT_241036 [Collybiopsis luxurians FD-317 M1]
MEDRTQNPPNIRNAYEHSSRDSSSLSRFTSGPQHVKRSCLRSSKFEGTMYASNEEFKGEQEYARRPSWDKMHFAFLCSEGGEGQPSGDSEWKARREWWENKRKAMGADCVRVPAEEFGKVFW